MGNTLVSTLYLSWEEKRSDFSDCCIIYIDISSVSISSSFFIQFILHIYNAVWHVVCKAEIIIIFLTPKLSHQYNFNHLRSVFSRQLPSTGQSSLQKSRNTPRCLYTNSPFCHKVFLSKIKTRNILESEETTAAYMDSITEYSAQLV